MISITAHVSELAESQSNWDCLMIMETGHLIVENYSWRVGRTKDGGLDVYVFCFVLNCHDAFMERASNPKVRLFTLQ